MGQRNQHTRRTHRYRLFSVVLVIAYGVMSAVPIAADSSASGTLTIHARTRNVLEISISVPNTTTVASAAFTFGEQLSIDGQNAAQSSCPALTGGARYLSPNVVVTVSTNLRYDIRRTAWGNFTPNRLFVRENGAFPNDCADLAFATLLPRPLTLIASTQGLYPTAGREYTEYFVFDVLPGDPTGSYSGGISYQAQVHL